MMDKVIEFPRVTRPITAWAFFNRIIKTIRTHERHFDMGYFIVARTPEPTCGTTCCIAGWGDVLLCEPGTRFDRLSIYSSQYGMKKALGVALMQKANQFRWSANRAFRAEEQSTGLWFGSPAGIPGDAEYIGETIMNIRRFMRENKKALKAKIVRPGMTNKTYKIPATTGV